MPSTYTEELLLQLDLLTQEYKSKLKSKLCEIEQHWLAWKDHADKDAFDLSELHRIVHNLSGSSMTFGFHDIGKICREFDEILSNLYNRSTGYSITESDQNAIDSRIKELRKTISYSLTNSEPSEHATSIHQRLGEKKCRNTILVLEDDDIYSREITYHLEYFGYQVLTCHTVDEVEEALESGKIDIMMFDIMMPGDNLGGINIFNKLREKNSDELPPCYFFSIREDLEARLATVKAGAKGFFVKPLDYGEVVDQLSYTLTSKSEERYRIMIVDDDIEIAKHASKILEHAGAVTRVIIETKELLHSLSDFKPELILMDLNMPYATGVELAKVIRQQSAYIGTIIVFYSTETQIHKHMEAMKSGGDDFLVKPVNDEDLVNTLFMRLMRARSVNNLMIRDSLTNLINHYNCEDMLKRELRRSSRTGDVLTYAMIDIDHFKSVNDQYGHLAGDKVLVTLSGFLKQKFRSTDIICRYGGEEFAVILPNTSLMGSLNVFEDIRQEFSQILHVSENERFNVTISIGLASSPPYADSDALQKAADQALYISKNNGRNQTSLAPLREKTI